MSSSLGSIVYDSADIYYQILTLTGLFGLSIYLAKQFYRIVSTVR